MRDEGDIVFIDFEASSLEKKGYPIEVAWVFASGGEESYLIKPAPDWTEWSEESEAIHRIGRNRLVEQGTPHDEVARRMVETLTGHSLYATAPSWDGQWLSKLLRAAGLPRHALRLQDTEVAHEEAVNRVLREAAISEEARTNIVQGIVAQARSRGKADGPPAHRALADARHELQIWRDVCHRAEMTMKNLRA